MNYQVFARKWRPKKFSEVVGQSHIVKAMIHSFKLNRIHHAYVLSGMKGLGKTTIARLFAKGLNCEIQIISDVCGKCKNCIDIELGCFVDLIEIDAASRTKVEDTREFLDNIQYAPSQGRFKVYLIDEVHMLSKHSFNALLKTLEEPPEHVKFILVTTEYCKIPETILSRCLQLHLKPLNIEQIKTQLTYICDKESIAVKDSNALELLAYAAQGSMRDALNLLEQAILLGECNITSDVINNMLGMPKIEYALSLVENLINGNINNIMNQINSYANSGINWDYLFNEILMIFQKMAMNQFSSSIFFQQGYNDKITHMQDRIHSLSTKINPESMQLYYQIFLLGRRELPYAPSFRMGMEMTILRALAFCPIYIDSDKKDNSFIKSSLDEEKFQKNVKNKIVINSNNFSNTNIITKDIKDDSHNFRNNVIDYKNVKCDTDFYNESSVNVKNTLQSYIKSNRITSDVSSEILEARSKVINLKKKINESETSKNHLNNKTVIPKKTLETLLQRFSKIGMNILDRDSNSKKKK